MDWVRQEEREKGDWGGKRKKEEGNGLQEGEDKGKGQRTEWKGRKALPKEKLPLPTGHLSTASLCKMRLKSCKVLYSRVMQ